MLSVSSQGPLISTSITTCFPPLSQVLGVLFVSLVAVWVKALGEEQVRSCQSCHVTCKAHAKPLLITAYMPP